MNAMPIDWLDQLKREYPKRSGPMSWPRVFLKLRRALIETNWDEIMEGVKRYAKYCQDAGTEGSSFVVAPARFFEDEIYLESLTFTPAKDPKVAAHEAQAAERWDRASRLANDLSVERYRGDSIDTFEERIRAVQNGRLPQPSQGRTEHPLSARITDLANRMRITK